MNRTRMLAGLLLLAMLALARAAEEEITPAQWLQRQEKPRFAAKHTLPPLTRFGWTLPMDARIELAENWGYCLEFGGYATDKVVDRALTDPRSDEAKLLALVASDPARYRLCIILSRDLPKDPPAETWARDEKGEFLGGKNKVWSPEAPMSVLQESAELRAGPLRRLRERVPVAMVLNGGEYALGVLGFAQKHWEQDPRIVAAKGDNPWFDYISGKKALMETVIADAVRKADPDRILYIYYTAGGGTHRNRIRDWGQWAHGFEWMRTASDLPSNEYYFRHFNDGWTGKFDLLTLALNSRGFELKHGAKFSYDWLCAGWIDESKKPAAPASPADNPAALVDPNAGKLGDLRLYEGLLKCLFTAGTVGGNAGYYAYPQGGFAKKFPAGRPPHWIRQMVTLARVQALFSHHEAFVRESDLVPGPMMHRWSTDQPAFELPSGSEGVRVLARKHAARPEWLLTAWAADGQDREVSVDVPGAGPVRIPARPDGGVYRITLEGGAAKATGL